MPGSIVSVEVCELLDSPSLDEAGDLVVKVKGASGPVIKKFRINRESSRTVAMALQCEAGDRLEARIENGFLFGALRCRGCGHGASYAWHKSVEVAMDASHIDLVDCELLDGPVH